MIDFHTHPVMVKELLESDADLARRIRDVFGFFFPAQPLEGFLLEMDEAGVEQAVLLPVDCSTAHGGPIVSNEQIARLVERNPRFIGFASVDPNQVNAPRQLEFAIKELGLRGLKLDPALQCFYPNSIDQVYPIYQVCAELGIPILMHCGMSWASRGQAKFAQPLLLEEVIQAFPTLNLILAHFAWPWIHEATMLAVKYPNVYLDTAILYSGTPQDALGHVLGEQVGLSVVERSLWNKILFGTNYPRIDMRRCVRGIRALGLKPVTLDRILNENARLLLGR